jgi:hypothetical protein
MQVTFAVAAGLTLLGIAVLLVSRFITRQSATSEAETDPGSPSAIP